MVLDRYLVDEIAVARFIADDGLDAVVRYSDPEIHLARIEEKTRTIRREDGTTVDSTTVIATRADIGERDRVWCAPMNGNERARLFPAGFIFVDADARTPLARVYARRVHGNRGFGEVAL